MTIRHPHIVAVVRCNRGRRAVARCLWRREQGHVRAASCGHPGPVPAAPAQTYQLVVTPDAGTLSADSAGAYADGKGTAARFHAIDSFAVDKNGFIFVSGGGNWVIRKITPDGTVSTLAGSAARCGYADGYPGALFQNARPRA